MNQTPKAIFNELNSIIDSITLKQIKNSVDNYSTAINAFVRCVDLADELIQRIPSLDNLMEYISVCEKICEKLDSEFNTPSLSKMIRKKILLVGETVKRLNS